jgi:glycerol kinase
VWDVETGEPLYNAIVWTDTRTQALVRKLKARLGSDKLHEICGLPLSTYPSVAKLLWMIENVPKVSDAYARGKLAFGTMDAWVVYKLNGGKNLGRWIQSRIPYNRRDTRLKSLPECPERFHYFTPPKTLRIRKWLTLPSGPAKNVFVTDPTNASRTMFMNLRDLAYDESLLDFFRFDMTRLHLPKIVRSSDAEAYGTLTTGVLEGVKIAGCLGDQSAALVGQKAFTPGRAKNT